MPAHSRRGGIIRRVATYGVVRGVGSLDDEKEEGAGVGTTDGCAKTDIAGGTDEDGTDAELRRDDS